MANKNDFNINKLTDREMVKFDGILDFVNRLPLETKQQKLDFISNWVRLSQKNNEEKNNEEKNDERYCPSHVADECNNYKVIPKPDVVQVCENGCDCPYQ